MLADDEMWKAVIDCDESCDGQFFYAVKTVGVYCRPSCRSRTPLRKNVRYFETGEEAEQHGFRPCKRCRPDIVHYAPAMELAQQAKKLIDTYFDQREHLWMEMKRLGVSANHLSVIFRQCFGVTPTEHLRQTRIQYSTKMLGETDIPIIQLAHGAGFESLSSFYSFFKRHMGTTPKEYRERTRGVAK